MQTLSSEVTCSWSKLQKNALGRTQQNLELPCKRRSNSRDGFGTDSKLNRGHFVFQKKCICCNIDCDGQICSKDVERGSEISTQFNYVAQKTGKKLLWRQSLLGYVSARNLSRSTRFSSPQKNY